MIKQEDIVKPLIFLDIFDYPPTAMEIWRFLGVKAELGEVVSCQQAADMSMVHAVENTPRPSATPLDRGEYNGFYFLSGREALIEKRREFVYLSEKKFKIATRAAWLLHFIPSIKMIAVCNNFYYREQSDIDFFIITAANRLWITRFFVTIILDIFGLRARGKKTADKICLSFYLSENNLNIGSIALQPAKYRGSTDIDDPYLAYWLAFLEPIYGQECYNKFWQANDWLKNIFPNASPKEPVKMRKVEDDWLSLAVRMIRGFVLNGSVGDWIERSVKDLQWKKISPRVKEMAALDDRRVVINDVMLKFHENDRREFFRDELEKKINMNK
jgi:hypothetical protein